MAPAASVIIVNLNSKEMLLRSIRHVLRQSYRDFEIIVVDNGSTDGSAQAVRTAFGNELRKGTLVLIANPKNDGFTGGNNIGYRRARGKYVILLNNDTEVKRDWLGTLIAPLERDPELQIVGSFEAVANKELVDIYVRQKRMAVMTLCGELVLGPREDDAGITPLFYVSGNGMAMRRKDFRKPFDDNYFAYAEDTYICWLSRLRGKKVGLTMKAQMLHHGGQTKKQGGMVNRIAVFNGTKNQIMNYLLFYEWKNIIRIAPLFMITQAGHVLQDPRKLIVKLKAYVWIMTHLRLIMRKRKAVQAQRRTPDREILRMMSCRFFDESLTGNRLQRYGTRIMNALFKAYCAMTLIRTREFS